MNVMKDMDLKGKRVLIREDLNVPLSDGKVSSDVRIRAALPTIDYARQAGAKVILMSHLGRPLEGEYDNAFSMRPVAAHLSTLLATEVELINNWREGIEINNSDVVLLENVRFNVGEKNNADELAQAYAALCDIFVMDAFGTAHRAQASTHGVARVAPLACAGPLLVAELDALSKALDNPARPLVAIVGGSKVSTKLTVLESLAKIADQLIVGGGIANTFIAAQGHNVGKSLYEQDLLETAQGLIQQAQSQGGDIPLPSDVVCGKAFSATADAELKTISEMNTEDMIFDIGPQTISTLKNILQRAGTIVWNGPVGVFEFDQFAAGTEALAKVIAESDAFSIAGGGDTLAAIDKYQVADNISYISTGGGAFLEFLEGKTLPAVDVLEQRSQG